MTSQPTHREGLEASLQELRPLLHRYCARLVGSVFDGEDLVQETLTRAFRAIDTIPLDTPLRPWLFRIAHNCSIDHLRSQKVRQAEPPEALHDDGHVIEGPEDVIARKQAVEAAFTHFQALPTSQRAAVILKDVLGYSLQEIGGVLGLNVNAVKATLSRGRSKLEDLRQPSLPSMHLATPTPEAAMFAKLFNERNWDALRTLLADDVRLRQSGRPERQGSKDVGQFFSIYSAIPDLSLMPGRILDGSEVIAVFAGDASEPGYFMKIDWRDGEIVRIRDYRYAPYVLNDAGLAFPPLSLESAHSETFH